jgi:hypothetical protein
MAKLTSEASRMSYQPTLGGLLDAISSQESAVGITPSTTHDGPPTGESGQALVLASLSAWQAKAKGLLTSGTYGLRGSTLSTSADLTHSLANRFRALTESIGSTLFALTWRASATASGRLIFRLRASGRRTDDSDCISWPTPDAGSFGTGDSKWEARREECKAKNYNGNGFGLTLGMATQLATWPTPDTQNHRDGSTLRKDNNIETGMHGVSLHHAAHLATWTTPQAHDATARGKGQKAKHGTKHGCADLNADAALTSWATPSARDWKDTSEMSKAGTNPDGSERSRLDQLPRQASLTIWATPRATDGSKGGPNQAGSKGDLMLPSQASLTASGETPNGSTAETENIGQLNPAFSLWLMGLPDAWASCGERAMRSFRRPRKRS